MNISLNKEPIKVNRNVEYIVIDALYIDDIKEKLLELRKDNIISEIKEKIFPYTDTPFAEYIPKNNEVNLNQIKKVEIISYEEMMSTNTFSVDSGILIFINKKNLINFISDFSYNELINSITDILNINYWKDITNNYLYEDIAMILSPGVESGVDFDGSGIYKIV